MKAGDEVRRIRREWIGAIAAFSVFWAPLGGCPRGGGAFNFDDLSGDVDLSTAAGLFLNDGSGENVVAAARGASGDVFFAYGSRNDAGDIEQITALLARTADGRESFITFDDGRPVHAQGPDGSYAHVTYEEVSSTQLRGTVDFYNAQDDTTTSQIVDIDLQQTAAEIAAFIEQRTGESIATTEVIDATAKTTNRQQVRITIFNPLFSGIVLPLVAAVGAMTILLGQIFVALYATLVAAVQAVLVAVFSPLFLIADLLSQTVVNIRLVPLFDVFAVLPPPPTVVLVS
ncbi:MAG: hypothetical protein D6744_01830 [Planctomycetota bacterium]|nr:MAG: hypothetical protein D6744_01830 [Planctomycetota bacterium]